MNTLKLTVVALSVVCMQQALQAQIIKFRKVIGNEGYDYGYYAEQTPDKGYILIGSTSSFSENADMYAIKTDSMGIPKLHKSFGGINLEKGYSVKRTSDNGYILAGYTNSSGAGGYDAYMVKIDSAFATQWEKTYGGTDWDFGNCVQQTSDGGYILCGSTYSYGQGNQDYYLVKTDANGDTLWTKTYGGAGDDVAKSVVQTSDGGYAITGTSKSLGDVNGDFYTIKTDAAGDTLWTNRYGGAETDEGNCIIESSTGEYILAGAETFTGNTDGVGVKLSSAGAYIETYRFPSGTNVDDFTYVSEALYGKYAFIGNTRSLGLNGDIQMVILTNTFAYVNSTTYGTDESDYGYSVMPTEDHGYILCGHTNGYHNGLDDIYLIKTDTTGLSGFSGSETFYVTGINEAVTTQESSVSVYPNPANSSLSIRIDASLLPEETIIIITDMLGREISARAAQDIVSVIDLQSLPDGMYAVTIRNKEFSTSKKLIVHH